MLSSLGRKSLLSARSSFLVRGNEHIGWIGCDVVTANSDCFSRRLVSNISVVKRSDRLTRSKLRISQPEQPKMNHFSSIRKMTTSSFLSPLNCSTPLPANYATVSKHDYDEFSAVIPDIMQQLTELAKQHGCEDIVDWIDKCLQHNLVTSPLFIGLTTVVAFKAIAKPDIITPENLKLARYLGGCIELLGCTVIIIDDILDGSEIRRSQPCWHKLDNVKMTGINDAFWIENGIYQILKKFFSHTSYYVKLLELFHEVTFAITTGELLDLESAKLSVDDFTMERFKTIAINKTGSFIFYLPLAMHMAGHSNLDDLNQLKQETDEMATFFQIQTDYIDCFGDPKKTGKEGSDIQTGKCTWLSVVCMERANEAQKNIMRENYGQDDPQKVAIIKQLYEDLEIPKTYAMKEQEAFTSDVPSNKIGKVYRNIFNHVWKKSDIFM